MLLFFAFVLFLAFIGGFFNDENKLEEPEKTKVDVKIIKLDDHRGNEKKQTLEKDGEILEINFSGPIDGDKMTNADLQKPLFAKPG